MPREFGHFHANIGRMIEWVLFTQNVGFGADIGFLGKLHRCCAGRFRFMIRFRAGRGARLYLLVKLHILSGHVLLYLTQAVGKTLQLY